MIRPEKRGGALLGERREGCAGPLERGRKKKGVGPFLARSEETRPSVPDRKR